MIQFFCSQRGCFAVNVVQNTATEVWHGGIQAAWSTCTEAGDGDRTRHWLCKAVGIGELGREWRWRGDGIQCCPSPRLGQFSVHRQIRRSTLAEQCHCVTGSASTAAYFQWLANDSCSCNCCYINSISTTRYSNRNTIERVERSC